MMVAVKDQTKKLPQSPHPDTIRLKTLIAIFEVGSCDFEELLFFARRKYKDWFKAYRHALDEYKENS
jgi:hypothetical protein